MGLFASEKYRLTKDKSVMDARALQAMWSRDGLAAALGSNFELVQEEEMPLVCRVNARKYEVNPPSDYVLFSHKFP